MEGSEILSSYGGHNYAIYRWPLPEAEFAQRGLTISYYEAQPFS